MESSILIKYLNSFYNSTIFLLQSNFKFSLRFSFLSPFYLHSSYYLSTISIERLRTPGTIKFNPLYQLSLSTLVFIRRKKLYFRKSHIITSHSYNLNIHLIFTVDLYTINIILQLKPLSLVCLLHK